MGKKYGFFPGCSYKTDAGYNDSVDALNRTLGIELNEISDWNCCGATAIFSWDETEALLLNGRIFALASRQGFEEIITTCNACYTTMRKAKRILEENPDIFERINIQLSKDKLKIERLTPVRHYLEILINDINEDAWTQNTPEYLATIKVGVYYGCQFTRPWSDVDHPERTGLLNQFITRLGFLSVEHSAQTLCCGASHLFPYENACRRLISRIIGEVVRKGGDIITTICPLCQFNLDSMQTKIDLPSVPIPYFTQLAGLALGITPKELGIEKLFVPFEKVLPRSKRR